MTDPQLEYRTPPPRDRLGFAMAALALAIASIPMELFLCSGVFVAICAMAYAATALTKYRTDARYGGRKLAIAAIIISAGSILGAIALLVHIMRH